MTKIKGKVISGYGIASGTGADPMFKEGSINMQAPFFKALGLDLSDYFKGTLNVDIRPFSYKVKNPKYYFKDVNWSAHIPSENFYFFDVTAFINGKIYFGLIYMPDPNTKVAHIQPKTVIEIILPHIKGINNNDQITLDIMQYNLVSANENL